MTRYLSLLTLFLIMFQTSSYFYTYPLKARTQYVIVNSNVGLDETQLANQENTQHQNPFMKAFKRIAYAQVRMKPSDRRNLFSEFVNKSHSLESSEICYVLTRMNKLDITVHDIHKHDINQIMDRLSKEIDTTFHNYTDICKLMNGLEKMKMTWAMIPQPLQNYYLLPLTYDLSTSKSSSTSIDPTSSSYRELVTMIWMLGKLNMNYMSYTKEFRSNFFDKMIELTTLALNHDNNNDNDNDNSNIPHHNNVSPNDGTADNIAATVHESILTNQGISMIMNGLSKYHITWSHIPVTLQQHLMLLFQQRVYRPSEVGSIMNALAVLKVNWSKDLTPQSQQALLNQLQSQCAFFTPREISNAVWSLGQMHFQFNQHPLTVPSIDPASTLVSAESTTPPSSTPLTTEKYRLLQESLCDQIIASSNQFRLFDIESLYTGLSDIQFDPDLILKLTEPLNTQMCALLQPGTPTMTSAATSPSSIESETSTVATTEIKKSPSSSYSSHSANTPSIFFHVNVLKAISKLQLYINTYSTSSISSSSASSSDVISSTTQPLSPLLLTHTSQLLLLKYIIDQLHSFFIPNYPILSTTMAILHFQKADMTSAQQSRYLAILSRIFLSYDTPHDMIILLLSLYKLGYTHTPDFIISTQAMPNTTPVEPFAIRIKSYITKYIGHFIERDFSPLLSILGQLNVPWNNSQEDSFQKKLLMRWSKLIKYSTLPSLTYALYGLSATGASWSKLSSNMTVTFDTQLQSLLKEKVGNMTQMISTLEGGKMDIVTKKKFQQTVMHDITIYTMIMRSLIQLKYPWCESNIVTISLLVHSCEQASKLILQWHKDSTLSTNDIAIDSSYISMIQYLQDICTKLKSRPAVIGISGDSNTQEFDKSFYSKFSQVLSVDIETKIQTYIHQYYDTLLYTYLLQPAET